MRSVRFALVAAVTTFGFILATFPADAQTGSRPRITVKKRSYLDPGTVVKPGTARYHDYAFPPESRFSTYGVAEGNWPGGAGRWPLPRPFELPGYPTY